MKSVAQTGLNHHFLIATPSLNDNIFDHSVIYICEHNENGSMGIKINHRLPVNLAELFSQLDIQCNSEHINTISLLDGGPVSTNQGFILHTTGEQRWDSQLKVSDHVYVTASKDILDDIAAEKGPDQHIVALGYAGWSAGQLESELKNNAWMTLPASEDILFNQNKENIWQQCIDQLGFDISQLSTITGNA